MPSKLIITFKQLGDLVTMQPALARLGLKCETYVYCKPQLAPLFELMDNVKSVDLLRKLGKVDELVVAHMGSREVRKSLFAKAKKRMLLTFSSRKYRRSEKLIYPLLFHEISALKHPGYWGNFYWLGLTGEGLEDFTPPRLALPPEAWQPSMSIENPYILIHPVAAWERKQWTVEGWIETINYLKKVKPDVQILMTGGSSPHELQHCQKIADQTGVLNLGGKTSITEYLYLVSRALATLCIDGSASHLSRAFARPTLTLFGDTDARQWHYPEPHAYLVEAVDETNKLLPLTALSVETVMGALNGVFEQDLFKIEPK